MMRLTLVTLVVLLGSLTGTAQQNQAGQQPFPKLSEAGASPASTGIAEVGKAKSVHENA